MFIVDDNIPVVFQLGHAGALTGAMAGMAEAVAVLQDDDRHVDKTTLILGPKDSGDGFELWTFFPGSALPQGEPVSMDEVRKIVGGKGDKVAGTVADAKKLGFKIIKHVPQLPQVEESQEPQDQEDASEKDLDVVASMAKKFDQLGLKKEALALDRLINKVAYRY